MIHAVENNNYEAYCLFVGDQSVYLADDHSVKLILVAITVSYKDFVNFRILRQLAMVVISS